MSSVSPSVERVSCRGGHTVRGGGVAGGTAVLAALLAAIVLRSRNKVYARIHDDETRDDDLDGIPDVYQRGPGRGGAATTDGNRTLG